MTQRDLLGAVSGIRADTGLKEKVLDTCALGKNGKSGHRAVRWAACAAAVLLVVFSAVFAPTVMKQAGTTASVPSNASMAGGTGDSGGIYSILLIGLDGTGKSDPGYNDAVMLLSLDTRQASQRWILTPFPRDLYVDIPGHGKNRLNTAYSMGGGQLCAQTLEQNFNIDIDDYAVVDYTGFIKIFENLGEVRLAENITEQEAPLINRYSGESAQKALKGGETVLTGKQALYYMRIRSLDGELLRIQREQTVSAAVMGSFKNAVGADWLRETAVGLLPYLTTSLSRDGALKLVGQAYECRDFPVSYFRVTDEFVQEKQISIGGHSADVLVAKPEYAERLRRFLYQNETS